MNEIKILENIRKLVRHEPTDFNYTEILTQHNCPYLLGLLSPEKNPKQIINALFVKERYRICANIF